MIVYVSFRLIIIFFCISMLYYRFFPIFLQIVYSLIKPPQIKSVGALYYYSKSSIP